MDVNKRMTLTDEKNTGLAMGLLALLLYWLTTVKVLLPLAGILLLLTLFSPRLFVPVVKPWQVLSEYVSNVMSTIILAALFFLLVTPVGLLRRLCGADPMQLCQWRQGADSVMRRREHLFVAANLERPY